MTQDARYLTVRQVADRFQVADQTVRDWVRAGDLDAVRLPGRRLFRIPVAAVEAIERGADPAVTAA